MKTLCLENRRDDEHRLSFSPALETGTRAPDVFNKLTIIYAHATYNIIVLRYGTY